MLSSSRFVQYYCVDEKLHQRVFVRGGVCEARAVDHLAVDHFAVDHLAVDHLAVEDAEFHVAGRLPSLFRALIVIPWFAGRIVFVSTAFLIFSSPAPVCAELPNTRAVAFRRYLT